MEKKGPPVSTRSRTPEQDALLRKVRQYQFIQRLRIGQSNQIGAAVRSLLIDKDQATQFIDQLCKPLEKQEAAIIRDAAKDIRDVPIWRDWLCHVRGIAETLAVQFIAHIQPISDFPTVGHLWAYAGMKVVDGEAVRRRRGQQSRWSPELKKLCFQAGTCFERCGGFYRGLYDNYKLRDRSAHPKKDATPQVMGDESTEQRFKYSDGHMRMRAIRYVAKLFLSHLWQVWREFEGLPVRVPYAIEYMGHTTIISPWSAVEHEVEAMAF